MSEIEKIAKQILVKGKGILAADESTGTMSKGCPVLKLNQLLKIDLDLEKLYFPQME